MGPHTVVKKKINKIYKHDMAADIEISTAN